MGVADEAVEDGVGVGWVADDVVPPVDGRLRGDHCRAPSVGAAHGLRVPFGEPSPPIAENEPQASDSITHGLQQQPLQQLQLLKVKTADVQPVGDLLLDRPTVRPAVLQPLGVMPATGGPGAVPKAQGDDLRRPRLTLCHGEGSLLPP